MDMTIYGATRWKQFSEFPGMFFLRSLFNQKLVLLSEIAFISAIFMHNYDMQLKFRFFNETSFLFDQNWIFKESYDFWLRF